MRNAILASFIERGRRIRYDRFDNEQARRCGTTSVGDVFRLKPCWT